MLKKNIGIHCILPAIFVLCGFMAYFNTINSFFLSDDFGKIYSVSKSGAFAVWSFSLDTRFFRPLISLSFFVDYKLWGLNPDGYHLTNTLVHSLNSYLVFLICLLLINRTRFLPKMRWSLSIFSGFIFLVLPGHSEAVAWISGRGDVIAAFFCLSSFCMYLFYRQNSVSCFLLISILLFVFALLSKESAISYPLVLLSYEIYAYLIEKRNRHEILSRLYPPLIYFLCLLLYFSVRYMAIGKIIGGYGKRVHLNLDFIRLLRNLIFFSARAILPPMPDAITAVLSATGIAVLVVAALLLMKRAKRFPLSDPDREKVELFSFLSIAFILSLLPAITLGISPFDTKGERFLYLASAFSSTSIIFLISFLINNRKYFAILVICLLSASGISLYHSNTNWKEAGEISKGILESLKPLGKVNRLFIINLPDNLNGAYIYRHGMNPALLLFDDTAQLEHLRIISHNSIYKVDDRLEITRRKGSNIYSVQLSNPKAYFIKHRFTSNYVEIQNFKRKNYDLTFKDLNAEDKIVFYSAGRMVKLDF